MAIRTYLLDFLRHSEGKFYVPFLREGPGIGGAIFNSLWTNGSVE